MKKYKYWGVAVVIGLLVSVASWWTTIEMIERKEPLNQFDAFVYSNNGMLYYFELTSRKGEVQGKLHELKLIEENGNLPFIEEKEYPLSGETTEKGYEFKVNISGEMIPYNAWFTGPHLSVQKYREKDPISYNPVDQEELESYVDALLLYHAEEKENNRRKKFFTELDRIYGYMYSSEDASYQLFLKIDEALQQGGELTGSLLKMTDTRNKNKPYEESRYVLNGITDGNMLKLFTNVDGKETMLKGNFYESATGFDLSFWTTDDKLSFQAVTEEEFKQSYEEFKTKAQLF